MKKLMKEGMSFTKSHNEVVKMEKKMGKNKIVEYIGTCTGTFLVSKSTKIDGSKRENIYSFSGEKVDEVVQAQDELIDLELE